MSYRREHRASRAALFDGLDGIEEGGLNASSYSRDTDERHNDRAVDSLQERVIFLKKLTGDIHEEVESHNRMLDKMGNGMDATRGIMWGTMDRFKMVFDKKSSQRMCTLVGCFVVTFFVLYYLFSFGRTAMAPAMVGQWWRVGDSGRRPEVAGKFFSQTMTGDGRRRWPAAAADGGRRRQTVVGWRINSDRVFWE